MNVPRGVCQLLRHEAHPPALPRPRVPSARQQKRSNAPGRVDADSSLPGRARPASGAARPSSSARRAAAAAEKRSPSPIRSGSAAAETQTAAVAAAIAEWKLPPRPPSAPPGPGGWSCAPDPERLWAEPAEAERRSALARPPWHGCALSLDHSSTSPGISCEAAALLGLASEGGATLVAAQKCELEEDKQEATMLADLAEEMRLRESAKASGPRNRVYRAAAAIERLLGQRQPRHFARGAARPASAPQVADSHLDLSAEGREQSNPSDILFRGQAAGRYVSQAPGQDRPQRRVDIPDADTAVETSGLSETMKRNNMSVFREGALKAVTLARVAEVMSGRGTDHRKEIAQRRQQRQQAERKLRAFDRRRAPTVQMKRASSDGDLQGDEADEGPRPGSPDTVVSMKSSKHGRSYYRTATSLPFADEEIKRKEMKFSVVKWSCQKSNGPAKSLAQQSGRWEAINGRIRNEYVVFEIEEPAAISEISFFLPGNDSAPHQLNMKYSKESADGPWRDAWRFEVNSKEDTFIKSDFDYQQYIQSFKNVLLTVCPGSIENAWTQLLDTNGDGRISFPEFSNAVHAIKLQIQALPPSKKGSVTESMKVLLDVQLLFESLDMDRSGKVELKDLRPNSGSPPEAMWWKLTVLNNWGSQKRLQILAPLTLCAKVRTTSTFSADLTQRFQSKKKTGGCEIIDYVSAFDTKLLNIDNNEINIRRLSRKYHMKNSLVEAVHKYFNEADQDKSGYIEEPEFNRLLLTLHGAKNSSEVPPGRLKFFWQQADRDSDGAIDFEEFLIWFNRYFSSEDEFESSNFVANAGFIGSYYSGLSRARIAATPLTPSVINAEWSFV